LLTLLVIPSFYDSIENSRDGALAKYRARERRWNPAWAFLLTALEAVATLLMLRLVWRLAGRARARLRARGTLPA
jgi:HAE1 family hydrophobic/amphiphilic exporter-1